MKHWLRNLFPDVSLSQVFVVERDNQVPMKLPIPDAPPRPLLPKLLNSHDRDVILQTARKGGPFRYDNLAISIFPNFSADLQKQRTSFFGIKRQL
ncbi:hypothetical protein GDO78_016179 [Eleutherodactylus coqui]|uniref:Uncharacterized protein n=1 Tax=Eleutherodactylus coqui TaxID=57060 RepID=A0A8J6BRP1_ELECQ|nr:hypothetical protein GDO78_016179 [Eleutherodactylus coqui]